MLTDVWPFYFSNLVHICVLVCCFVFNFHSVYGLIDTFWAWHINFIDFNEIDRKFLQHDLCEVCRVGRRRCWKTKHFWVKAFHDGLITCQSTLKTSKTSNHFMGCSLAYVWPPRSLVLLYIYIFRLYWISFPCCMGWLINSELDTNNVDFSVIRIKLLPDFHDRLTTYQSSLVHFWMRVWYKKRYIIIYAITTTITFITACIIITRHSVLQPWLRNHAPPPTPLHLSSSVFIKKINANNDTKYLNTTIIIIITITVIIMRFILILHYKDFYKLYYHCISIIISGE